MIDLEQVRFILGVIGTVTTIGVLAHPMPRFVAMYKKKSVDKELRHNLLVDAFIQFMLWTYYGLVNKDSSILVPTLYGFALVCCAIFLTVYYICCGDKKDHDLCRGIMSRLLLEIIGVVAVVLITLFAIESSSLKVTFVGVISLCYNLDMQKYHLIEMGTVVMRENVEHISYWRSIVGLSDGMVWAAFSCISKFDRYIFISCVLQTLVYGSKLIVYARYYKRTPKLKPY